MTAQATAPDPLRIVELIATLEVGGAERQVVTLARALAARGHAITVVALTRLGPLAAELRAAGIDVRCVDKQRKLDLPALRRLRALLRDLAPDVLHAHLFTAGLYGRLAARPLGVPVVVTEHGYRLDQTPLKRALEAWLARRTAAITAPTAALARAVAGRLIPRGRVRVIPNAVALGPEPVDPGPWGGVHPLRVVTVGRLARSKDLPTLLRAVTAVRDPELVVELTIVGDGPERAPLERLAADLATPPRRVRWCGALDASGVQRELDRAHLFATASRTEGQSVALLEALARGRPVIATELPGVREAVDASVGALVPVGRVGALTAALEGLARDRAGWAGRSAAARLRARRFGVEAVTSSYEATLVAASRSRCAASAPR